MKINSDRHWQVGLYSAKINNLSFSLTSKSILFDTGSSSIYLPTIEYDFLIN
jgi:hypothetical protein